MAAREAVNVWTVIQARLHSERFPRKVLADLGGKPMIDRVYERAERIGFPVCVAIPDGDTDLANQCLWRGWTYITGSEDDVLQRFVDAATACKADHVVRVTADCPFLDVEAARWAVQHHLHTHADFTTYHHYEGRSVQVFTRELLEESNRLASTVQRHSPDVWVMDNWGRYHVETMKYSVDTPEDLEVARRRV